MLLLLLLLLLPSLHPCFSAFNRWWKPLRHLSPAVLRSRTR
jgi:hypothetical protein